MADTDLPTPPPSPSISEVLAASMDAVNTWLAQKLKRPELQVFLVSPSTAKRTAIGFERNAKRGRQVGWNWQELFFKKVRYQEAWMFCIVSRQAVGAMCYGTISVKDGHVAIEYLERASDAFDLKGMTISVAFQFALSVAKLLGVSEVRINRPFEALVPIYQDVLGGVAYPENGPIQYISIKV